MMRLFCHAVRPESATWAALVVVVLIAMAASRETRAQDRPDASANLTRVLHGTPTAPGPALDRNEAFQARPGLQSPNLPFVFFPSEPPAGALVVELPQSRPTNAVADPPAEMLPDPKTPELPAGQAATPEPPRLRSISVWSYYLTNEPAADANDAPVLASPLPSESDLNRAVDVATPAEPAGPAENETAPSAPKVAPEGKEPSAVVVAPGPQGQASSAVAAPPWLLEAKARWAHTTVRSACDLAARRLLYSTRAKLLDALFQIAQSLDETSGAKGHTASLGAALETLREADDFSPRCGALACDIDVARIASRHHTPAAASLAPDIGPVQATRHYYTFARRQLASAFASAPTSTGILWGLGKVYLEISREPDCLLVNGQAKAIVFQEAAVAVDPTNWQAANELGVLLAKAERWQEAALALRQSLLVRNTPETWHNLAVVSEQLGQAQQAQDARQRSVAAGYRPDQSAKPTVEWVPPAALAKAGGQIRGPSAANDNSSPQPAAASPADDGKPKATTRRLFDRLPWSSTK